MLKQGRWRGLVPALLWVALAGTAQAQEQPDWDSAPAKIFTEGDTLHFHGGLERDDVNRLLLALRELPASVTRLAVTSRGGDAIPSIAAAEAVHARGLAVDVIGRGCGSSCANYLFVPAREKTIAPGALVMFHNSCPAAISTDPAFWRGWLMDNYGNALRIERSEERTAGTDEDVRRKFEQGLDAHADEMVRITQATQAGHQRIFANRSIDDRMLCLGDHIDLPQLADSAAGGYMYTLPVADMARFGVCNIRAPADYTAQAQAYFDSRTDLKGRVGVVTLAEHPELVPSRNSKACPEG